MHLSKKFKRNQEDNENMENNSAFHTQTEESNSDKQKDDNTMDEKPGFSGSTKLSNSDKKKDESMMNEDSASSGQTEKLNSEKYDNTEDEDSDSSTQSSTCTCWREMRKARETLYEEIQYVGSMGIEDYSQPLEYLTDVVCTKVLRTVNDYIQKKRLERNKDYKRRPPLNQQGGESSRMHIEAQPSTSGIMDETMDRDPGCSGPTEKSNSAEKKNENTMNEDPGSSEQTEKLNSAKERYDNTKDEGPDSSIQTSANCTEERKDISRKNIAEVKESIAGVEENVKQSESDVSIDNYFCNNCEEYFDTKIELEEHQRKKFEILNALFFHEVEEAIYGDVQYVRPRRNEDYQRALKYLTHRVRSRVLPIVSFFIQTEFKWNKDNKRRPPFNQQDGESSRMHIETQPSESGIMDETMDRNPDCSDPTENSNSDKKKDDNTMNEDFGFFEQIEKLNSAKEKYDMNDYEQNIEVHMGVLPLRPSRYSSTEGEENYKCHQCPEKFATLADLIKHWRYKMRLHIRREKPFRCSRCAEIFKAMGNYECHVLRCPEVLDDKYSKESNRDKEKDDNTKDECSDSSIQTSANCIEKKEDVPRKGIVEMKESNSEESESDSDASSNNYFCDFCEELFDTEVDLKKHKCCDICSDMIECILCDKIFTEADYEQHKEIHMCFAFPSQPSNSCTEGEENYECNKCPEKFATFDDLEKHIHYQEWQRDSDNRLYRCSRCSRRFRIAVSFENHVRKCHSRSNLDVSDYLSDSN